MLVPQLIFICIGCMFFIFSFLVWKKRIFKLMAGYQEGKIKESNKSSFAKFNGIMFIIVGLWSIGYSFFINTMSIFVFVIGVIIFSMIQTFGSMKYSHK